MDFLSVSEAANEIGAVPRDITNSFYSRRLDTKRCPIVAGRRLIPRDYLPELAAELQRRGHLPQVEENQSCGTDAASVSV